MTEADLIARQAMQIEELRDEVAMLRDGIRKARGHIYCIGGPLNDNLLGFTSDQRKVFHYIAAELPAPEAE